MYGWFVSHKDHKDFHKDHKRLPYLAVKTKLYEEQGMVQRLFFACFRSLTTLIKASEKTSAFWVVSKTCSENFNSKSFEHNDCADANSQVGCPITGNLPFELA